MSGHGPFLRYGVRIANEAHDGLDEAAETLGLLGYAVVDSGLDAAQLDALRTRFAAMYAANHASHDAERLRAISEVDLLRCPLAHNPLFPCQQPTHPVAL